MTSILSDTLAPPRIATNGRSGDSSAWPRYLQLLLHQQAGRRPRHVMGDRLDRRVRAVRRAERVVHVELGQRGQRLRRTPDRSFPPPRETGGSRAARRVPRDRCASRDRALGRCLADAVVANATGRPTSSDEPRGDGRRLNSAVRLAFRPAQMAREDDGRALLERVLDRRQRGPDARVVADHAVLERDVEVHADEDALAGEVEIPDRQLRHGRSIELDASESSSSTSSRSRSTQRLE